MSAYSGPGNSYPHHPLPHAHAQLHQQVNQSNGQLAHHSHVPLQYQYPPHPPQHHQPIYENEHINGHATQVVQQVPANGGPEPASKGNRLRKACDSCSIRKVKCDETGPPCKACAALDIPCTFARVSRRRGPPNRHAEEIKEKRRRLEQEQGSPSIGDFSSPTSPNIAATTLANFSTQAVLSAEAICPLDTLKLLVDDFFTYIHPLCPFPHEPSFKTDFQNRLDLSNPTFLALLASMVGVLVASFPRRPRLHLKAQARERMFPTSISLVDRCHKIAVEARGPGYLSKELTIYDAVTSYFLGLAAAYTFQGTQSRLYLGETLNMARVLGAHKTENNGYLSVSHFSANYDTDREMFSTQVQPGVDYIRQEISRRIFWVMFVGARSLQQLGPPSGELLIPPPTPSDPYPPLPLEVDDKYIFRDHIERQPEGITSKLAGFNLGVEIYQTLTPLTTMEMAYGVDQVFDWNRQKKVLEDALYNVKNVLRAAPQELLLQPNPQSSQYEHADHHYYPPVADYPSGRANGGEMGQWSEDDEAKRNLQFEIQKANIYASQLGTRSYVVEKYWNLHEVFEKMKANNGGVAQLNSPSLMESGLDRLLPTSLTGSYGDFEKIIATERESIVKDLLCVLGTIRQVNMEPNASSFINKVRLIASTLIETPTNRKGPLAVKSEEYLARFVDVLMKLERISPGVQSENPDGSVDEEEELRNWADLRDYQMRFVQSDGFSVE